MFLSAPVQSSNNLMAENSVLCGGLKTQPVGEPGPSGCVQSILTAARRLTVLTWFAQAGMLDECSQFIWIST